MRVQLASSVLHTLIFSQTAIQQYRHGVTTPRSKEHATEVSWEDQQRINKFSSLINKKDDLQDTLKNYTVEGISWWPQLEIENAWRRKIPIQNWRSIFLSLHTANPQNREARRRIGKQNIQDWRNHWRDRWRIGVVKKQLYAKFGSNINLER